MRRRVLSLFVILVSPPLFGQNILQMTLLCGFCLLLWCQTLTACIPFSCSQVSSPYQSLPTRANKLIVFPYLLQLLWENIKTLQMTPSAAPLRCLSDWRGSFCASLSRHDIFKNYRIPQARRRKVILTVIPLPQEGSTCFNYLCNSSFNITLKMRGKYSQAKFVK